MVWSIACSSASKQTILAVASLRSIRSGDMQKATEKLESQLDLAALTIADLYRDCPDRVSARFPTKGTQVATKPPPACAARPSKIKSVPFLLALTFTAGCVHTFRFQPVDATSGQPITGVTANWHEHSQDLLTGTVRQTGPTNLPPSGDGTLFTVPNLHSKRANHLVLSKPGYQSVHANYNASNLWLTEKVRQLPPGDPILEDPSTKAAVTNGMFLVPMHR
jgi:hypothetical protein